MKMTIRLTVLAIVAVLFVSTAFAQQNNAINFADDAKAKADVNKPADANKAKDADKKAVSANTTITLAEKGKADVNEANEPNKAKPVVAFSDFTTYAKEANDVNKPKDVNKMCAASDKEGDKGKSCPADPNKVKDANKTTVTLSDLTTYAEKADKDKKGKKGKHDKHDANKPADSNKPSDSNKMTVSLSDFTTYAKAEANDVNKAKDVNKLAAEGGEKGEKGEKGKHKGKGHDPNKPADSNKPAKPAPAEPNKNIVSLSSFTTYAKDVNDVNKPKDANKLAEEGKDKAKACPADPNKVKDANDKK